MDRVIFILGPTGVGKSDISIKLAKEFNGEIISSDSVQIFKGFDIGSAKTKQAEMQGVVHYAIDIVEPQDYFSVYDFVEYTRQKIKEINEKGKLAIVVGGTGLYIKALIEGYNFGDADKHDDFRLKTKEFAEKEGNIALWQKLKAKNPEMADKIEPNNQKRVIRALELCEFGKKQTKNPVELDYLLFALNIDREILYQRINKRVDIMLKEGLIQEVENLLKQGVSKECQPMRAIGYKEVISYLDGELGKEQAIELIKQHSRNYAKRQLTFLRGIEGVDFVDVEDKESAYQEIKTKIQNFLKGEKK